MAAVFMAINLVNHIKGKYRLSVLENRVLRKISGCKKRINGSRKLHNKQIFFFFSSPNIIRSIEFDKHRK